LKPPQVRALARAGFIAPQRGPRGQYQFSFQDIVLLRTADSLRRAHVPQPRMQKAFESLKKQLPGNEPLSALRIEARGEHIVVSDGDRAWDVETDQLQIDFPEQRGHLRAWPAPTGNDSRDADAWYQAGIELEASAPDQARSAYERAVELDPTHADAQVNLGRLLHQRGMVAEAAERYRLALLHARHPTAAFNLGIALEDMRCTTEAVQAYRSALSMDPTLADAHYNLSRIYEANGDLITAIQHLKAYRSLRRPLRR
jgi:tetratricopeptide (TPR) repeat protein